ncbi:MAG: hypothetical protein II330_07380, partial [Clostridia bacterium]|nr:hypothetical protein [Clostridia bacterium]
MASITRIQNLGANGTPDVILFFGAGNDMGRNIPAGSFDSATAPTKVDLSATKWETLADAYVTTIMRLQHFYPDAKIVAMSTYAMPSYVTAAKLDKYGPTLRAICEHYGVEYLSLRDCGVTFDMLPDKIHPNAEGMDHITAAVMEKLLSDVALDAGANTVYPIKHNLSNATASKHYYKGVSAGSAFTEVMGGGDLSVTVTMGGTDITADCYANGVITIPEITGELVITAKGRFNADGHLQELPDHVCAGTNLWQVLEPENIYYTATGWGNTSAGTTWSITLPVKAGDKIWATSLGATPENGSTANGVRVTWFDQNGVLQSLSRDVVYAEFAQYGYITAPAGAVALNLPMTGNQDHYAVYILSAEHTYTTLTIPATCTEGGWTVYTCTKCGDSYEADFTEATGHSYGDWVIVTPSTCTTDGEKQRSCESCGDVQTEAIKASHDLIEHPEKMHSCTESGWLAYETCSRCDYSTLVEVAPTGHRYEQAIHSVAHRGFSSVAPENTLAAYRLAKQKGFTHVECDVAFTADGIPVLLHDATIDRTSDGSGKVTALTYEQLLQYDFGSWKSAEYAGTQIPTFEEFIALCAELSLHPNIELKSGGGYTQENVQLLVDLVEKYGMTGKVNWISFNHTYLTYVKNADPTARLGFIKGSDVTDSLVSSAKKLQSGSNQVFLMVQYSLLTNTGVLRAAANDFAVEVYTVNSESAVMALPTYVSGVTSDKIHAQNLILNKSKVTIPATCTEGGWTVYTCTTCGHEYEDDFTEPTGHAYKNGVCTECGQVDTRVELFDGFSSTDFFLKSGILSDGKEYVIPIYSNTHNARMAIIPLSDGATYHIKVKNNDQGKTNRMKICTFNEPFKRFCIAPLASEQNMNAVNPLTTSVAADVIYWDTNSGEGCVSEYEGTFTNSNNAKTLVLFVAWGAEPSLVEVSVTSEDHQLDDAEQDPMYAMIKILQDNMLAENSATQDIMQIECGFWEHRDEFIYCSSTALDQHWNY